MRDQMAWGGSLGGGGELVRAHTSVPTPRVIRPFLNRNLAQKNEAGEGVSAPSHTQQSPQALLLSVSAQRCWTGGAWGTQGWVRPRRRVAVSQEKGGHVPGEGWPAMSLSLGRTVRVPVG